MRYSCNCKQLQVTIYLLILTITIRVAVLSFILNLVAMSHLSSFILGRITWKFYQETFFKDFAAILTHKLRRLLALERALLAVGGAFWEIKVGRVHMVLIW